VNYPDKSRSEPAGDCRPFSLSSDMESFNTGPNRERATPTMNQGPELVDTLSTVLSATCEAFARVSGQPVNSLTRSVLAKRIMECADSGEEDPDRWKEFALGGFL
jgi:hypothetical protein